MPKFKSIILFCSMLLVLGCSEPQLFESITAAKPLLSEPAESQRRMLIGHWLVETPLVEGGFRKSLSTKHADGQFEIEFYTIYPDGEIETSKEVGLWGANDGIQFVLTLGWEKNGQFVPANRENGYFDDTYRIIHLTADEFEYQTLPNGNYFRAKRVHSGYDLSGHTGVRLN